MRTCVARRRWLASRAISKGFRKATERGGRARDHALRRAEAADGDRARPAARSANPDIGRRTIERGHADEERILTHLAGVMQGRTVILISHRVSTVRQADRDRGAGEGKNRGAGNT